MNENKLASLLIDGTPFDEGDPIMYDYCGEKYAGTVVKSDGENVSIILDSPAWADIVIVTHINYCKHYFPE